MDFLVISLLFFVVCISILYCLSSIYYIFNVLNLKEKDMGNFYKANWKKNKKVRGVKYEKN